MGLLDAGGSGWCLRWSATASRVVYDGQHGRCSLVSARGPGDGGEVLKGSRFPGCCSRQLGLPPHGKLRDNYNYRAAHGRGLFQKIARLGLRFREYGQEFLKVLGTLLGFLAGTAVH